MTAILQEPTPAAKPVRRQPATTEQRFLLHNVSWESYVGIGNALPDRPALRLTYDRGELELMTTSTEHELYKKWLGRLIETMAEETNRGLFPAGNMTFQREDLERGLEADDAFWIQHEPIMRGKLRWDPHNDPPADLATEIEISRSAIARMAIYAALRVAEVWCFDGSAIRVYCLQEDQTYKLCDRSVAFPEVPIGELVRFLKLFETMEYLAVIREVRAWLRQILGKNSS